MNLALDLQNVYIKTDLGRQVIARRTVELSRAARTVLLLVDGLTTVKNFGPLLKAARASDETLIELEQMGLIVASPGTAASVPPPAEATRLKQAPLSENEAFDQLYSLMVEVSASFLGLRGYVLQLKLERCLNALDLMKLRDDLLQAVASRHGAEVAKEINVRIKALV